MKKNVKTLSILIMSMMLIGCASHSNLVFTNNQWHRDNMNERLINQDASIIFHASRTMNDHPQIISSTSTVQAFQGLEKYLCGVLKEAGLIDVEILAYYADINTLWVKLPKHHVYKRPVSITIGMDQKTPYTSWITDEENWKRQDNEMFSYTHVNKRKKRLLITDIFNYQDMNVARIRILQSDSKAVRKIGLRNMIYFKQNTTDIHHIEMIANWVDSHRDASLKDYRLGRKSNEDISSTPTLNNKEYDICIAKADSSYAVGNFHAAYSYINKAAKQNGQLNTSHLYNAASIAALVGEKDVAFSYLFRRLEADPNWYLDIMPYDYDLQSLHQDERWTVLMDSLDQRGERIEPVTDKPLRAELLQIRQLDQRIRQLYLRENQKEVKDSLLLSSISHEWRQIDERNTKRICEILDSYGWPGKQRVGYNACFATWLVIQHADVKWQKKYLPLFREASVKGELPGSIVAMMEDRILMNDGLPQKYGSQITKDEQGNPIVYKLQDPSKVNQWRTELGMDPLQEYAKRFGVSWKP